MEPKVLSIQSWVCHGYVGNKCAVFALQHLGIEVDPILSVQFSNNTAYSTWKGESLTPPKLMDLFQGLEENHLTDSYTHVLTGYNNNSETLHTVLNIIKKLKTQNPNLIYVCDPVLGDNNALYVPTDLVSVYKNEVIPHADYIFPNQTEVEFLTGIKINNEQDALKAIDQFHKMGVKNVVITSLFFDSNPNDIIVIGSSLKNKEDINQGYDQFKITVGPKFTDYYTGTGDLFSSLLLGWSIKEPSDLSLVCEKATSILYNIIKETHKAKQSIPSNKGKEYYELRLVQSRKFIENSEILFKSQKLN
ncbi:hypothetical protein DICPUDRAFT_41380 [Dictyostelium purpureum]|uniref:pyridoxal kinase n=1 Tax=Dictyostelium purpureum TaxID=5786 RepID=F0ZZZ2_DICPU|nr:uncharacterized protein DICPUDRAFT_41380 [Dictyostelium purpureum]EGC30480.1 hypothetical protein DICPUDRAFT_41380 [Dictyostelium purpureum]|eukprot:XP_003292982.1 hypothetical protein DICPUDRAFT_41380 [Dictyostelium purpureum]